LKSLLAFAGYNLFFGLTAGIDNSAHVGGLLAGLVLGAALSKHIIVAAEIRRQWSKFVLIGMAVVLLSATVLLRRQYPGYESATIQYSDIATIQKGLKALQQGQYEQAIAPMQKYVQLDPKSAQAHYLLGLAYEGANRPDEAIASFQQALKLKPNYADAEAGLSRAYSTKGMQKEADEASRKATDLSGR